MLLSKFDLFFLYVLFRTYLYSVPPDSPPAPDLLVTVPPDLPVHLSDRRSLHAGVCNLTRQDETILILKQPTACHGRHGYLKMCVVSNCSPHTCYSVHSQKKTDSSQCQCLYSRDSPVVVHASTILHC